MVVFLAVWLSWFVLGAFCIMHELNVLGDHMGTENDCFYVCACIVKRFNACIECKGV